MSNQPAQPESRRLNFRAWSSLWILAMAVYCTCCWYGMMAVHELGHVIGAWLTGGVVERVVLHPLAISRTDLSINPHPLPVVWCGPVLGCLFPILIWLTSRQFFAKAAQLARFFAGFCCVANGAYLGIGSFESIGDAGDLLKHQCPIGYLWLFGIAMIPAGFALWNGLGPASGIAKMRSRGV